ncbi:MAG TPA: ABC transporter permease [Firmicutes bacterium]|jgi:NitT/TauT family transport system permease protein|nr:ABC transporter permease [Bacillota bacterium]
MNLNRLKDFILNLRKLLGVLVFLLLWEIITQTRIINPAFVPPFSTVVATFASMACSGELFGHIAISLQRAFIGFGLGLLFAIPMGFIIGWFKGFEYYVDPLLQTFRQISTIALLPVFMFLFGIGELSKVALVFWGVQWAVLLNTISGVKSVDPLLVKSARSMCASPFTLFYKVILPSAFPNIFTGIRLSATTSILILTAAEMLGASKGLGFLLFDAETKYQIPRMFSAIVAMAILGVVINYALQMIEKRINRWKESA